MKKESIANLISEKIIRARTQRGWTVYRLAKEAGVSTASIYALESGGHVPRIDSLNHLCSLLGITIVMPMPEE